jgi:hypothetical protein
MTVSLTGSPAPGRIDPGKNPAKTLKRMARNCGRPPHFQSKRPRGWRQRCMACRTRNPGAPVADRCIAGDHVATIGASAAAARRNFPPRTSGIFAFRRFAPIALTRPNPLVRLSDPDRPGRRRALPLCYKPRGPFIAHSTVMDRQNACCTSDGGRPVRGALPCCPECPCRPKTDTLTPSTANP